MADRRNRRTTRLGYHPGQKSPKRLDAVVRRVVVANSS